MLRKLKLSDLVTLSKDNKLPQLYNGPFKLIRSIEENGKLIGSFWVRITTENSLVLRKDLTRLEIARAMKEMYEFLYCKVPEELGISDSFVIFENEFDENYVNLLKKHFPFEEMSKVLRLRRNDAQ
jgi:hypothetical protein